MPEITISHEALAMLVQEAYRNTEARLDTYHGDKPRLKQHMSEGIQEFWNEFNKLYTHKTGENISLFRFKFRT